MPHFRERHALTAINLPLHGVWRFDGRPQAYYLDWVKAAAEEAHISLLRAHLQSLGHGYGDFPAGTGLWDRTAKTAGDVLVRRALVPNWPDATRRRHSKVRSTSTPGEQLVSVSRRLGELTGVTQTRGPASDSLKQ